MKTDSPEVLGYSKLPAQLKLARKCAVILVAIVFLLFATLWCFIDDAARQYGATYRDHAYGQAYAAGFFSGVLFAVAMLLALIAVLEAVKLYLKGDFHSRHD